MLVHRALPPQSVFAEHLTVIAGVDNQGVLEKTRLSQRGHEFTDHPVHERAEPEVPPALTLDLFGRYALQLKVIDQIVSVGMLLPCRAAVVGRHIVRMIRIQVPQLLRYVVRKMRTYPVHREYPGTAKPRRGPSQPIRGSARKFQIPGTKRFAGTGPIQTCMSIRADRKGMAAEVRVARLAPVPPFEDLGETERRVRPAVRLPPMDRVHALGVECARPRVLRSVEQIRVVVRRHLVRTEAREEGRSTRRAQRRGTVGRIEHDPARGQLVQGGGLHERMTVGAREERIVLVGEEEKDVARFHRSLHKRETLEHSYRKKGPRTLL